MKIVVSDFIFVFRIEVETKSEHKILNLFFNLSKTRTDT